MAWRKINKTAEDLGYDNRLDKIVPGIIDDVYNKKISDVEIPVTYGTFEVGKPKNVVKAVLKITPTKEQLDSFYSQLPVYLYNLDGDKNTAELYIEKCIKGDSGEPIKYHEEVRFVEGRRVDEDYFKARVIFPESLTEDLIEIDGFKVQDGFDEQAYSIAAKIYKQAEKDGFETRLNEPNCFREFCICPKEIGEDEIIKELKDSSSINFIAKGYRFMSKEPKDLEQKLWLETALSSLEFGIMLDELSPNGINLKGYKGMGLLGELNIEIEPDAAVGLKESYATATNRLMRKIDESVYPYITATVDGVGDLCDYVTGAGRRRKERKIVLNTLKEGRVKGIGDSDSCFVQIDPVCMLDRAKRNKE
ncbi:MAG: hypothetical protein KAT28_05675 [Candidatus Aenigmarchaeota archaeon]|nr:hypothetical protein [Candidatus Aenigmarchaeota archaeon]